MTDTELFEAKILHLLAIYPKISHSMMQIGLGSSIPTQVWKPILRQMINDGRVCEDFVVHPSALGRSQTYTILSLGAPVKVVNNKI